ncbi:MAG: hypothetical protein M1837_005710 [Sclerophora amabilis]|nr:MAG: hypothetical protein M1837_005710 [Sclerophora amabilis]
MALRPFGLNGPKETPGTAVWLPACLKKEKRSPRPVPGARPTVTVAWWPWACRPNTALAPAAASPARAAW